MWFRDSTRNTARGLGITGHAINLPDGNVEVLASGTPGALLKLKAWLHEGPPLSSVSQVNEESLPPQALSDFRIG